jgi:hypothetical protein
VIQLLFTTSDKPLSRVIRWATGECCSHVAILVSEEHWGLSVVHANWKGVHVEPLNTFLDENKIIHSVDIPENIGNLRRLQGILRKRQGSMYDLGALLFVGIALFCRKALGLRKWPKQNLWQVTGMYMCTEFVTEYLYGSADAMITPHGLYERIINK